MNDEIMSEAVYAVVLESFLKTRPNQDVYVLAAARLSVDYLKDGWKDLKKYQDEKEVEERNTTNRAL